MLSGVRVIRAFDRTATKSSASTRPTSTSPRRRSRSTRLFALMIPTLTAILNLSTVAIMWFGSIQVADHGMPIGDLTAFLTYIVQILHRRCSWRPSCSSWCRARRPRPQRIQEVLETQPTVIDPESPAVDVAASRPRRVPGRRVPLPRRRGPGAQRDHLHRRSRRGHRHRRQHRQRQDDARSVSSRASTTSPAAASSSTASTCASMALAGPVEPDRPRAAEGVPVQRHGGRATCATATSRRPTRSSGATSRSPRAASSSPRCPRSSRRASLRAAPASPAASASAWPSPGRWPSAPRSRSSTTASRRSTSPPTRACVRRSSARPPTPR